MKTLKQIADELGVTKDKVKYRVGKLPGNCVVKTGEITHVTDEGIQILRGFFGGEKVGNLPGEKPGNSTHRIEMLEAESDAKNILIEELKARIEEQKATIEGLINSLNVANTAQALHAAQVARLPDGEAKPGFFARLFRRGQNL